MKQIIGLLIVMLVTGCADIQHYSSSEQPLGKQTIVGVGDVVLRVNKQRDLANIAGKADVYGRKTNEGFSELRFAGVEKNGEIVLYRKDTQIFSNETTMSRSGIAMTFGGANSNMSGSYSGTANNGTLSASGNTSYASTTLIPTSEYHVVIPADTFPIRVSPSETKIPMEGYIVEIIKATPLSLEYKISKQN